MKIIKLLSLFLALLMLLTMFIGCGKQKDTDEAVDNSGNEQASRNTNEDGSSDLSGSNSNETTSNEGYITSKEDFVNKMEKLLDLSLYNDLSESDNKSFVSYSYAIKSENKKEYDLDYKMKLGDGTEFTMPITFSDLEKKGWFLQKSSAPDREMEAGLMTFGTVQNASGKTLRVAAYNPTDKTIAFKECTVINADAQQYSTFDFSEKLKEAIDFTVCGTLTNDSTLEDIIKRLGNPYLIYCSLSFDDDGKYTHSKIIITYMQKSSAYSQLQFELSGDGDYITAVNYDVAPQ